MSVIVIAKDKKRVVVGCDTRMSSNSTYNDSYKSRPKAVKLKDGTIIGAVGNIALLDVLEHYAETVFDLNREEIMYKVVIPMMRDCSETCLITNNREFDGEMVIAKRHKAFVISPIGTIEEVNNFQAIGSGKLPATASMQMTYCNSEDTVLKVARAIDTAGKIVPSVSRIAMIADTKELDFEQYKVN